MCFFFCNTHIKSLWARHVYAYIYVRHAKEDVDTQIAELPSLLRARDTRDRSRDAGVACCCSPAHLLCVACTCKCDYTHLSALFATHHAPLASMTSSASSTNRTATASDSSSCTTSTSNSNKTDTNVSSPTATASATTATVASTSPPPSPSDAALIGTRKKKRSFATKDDAEYIPVHLRQYVFHSQEDFYVSRHFDPVLLAHLMYEGFLPIASEYRGECFLIPKLHRKRCILVIENPEHVPKSVKKRGKKYKLELNQAFDEVVKGCHDQHGVSWLYPPIVEGFRAQYEAGQHGIEIYPDRHVRFYSVELVDVETNTVAAGELGYTVGRTYTSLTGFSRVSGAGTVQLHALGRLLYLGGFLMWDLGMSMPYKLSLGAEDVERDVFLDHLYKWRHDDCLLELHEAPLQRGGVHVKALFEITRAPRTIPMRKDVAASGDAKAASGDTNSSGTNSSGTRRSDTRSDEDD